MGRKSKRVVSMMALALVALVLFIMIWTEFGQYTFTVADRAGSLFSVSTNDYIILARLDVPVEHAFLNGEIVGNQTWWFFVLNDSQLTGFLNNPYLAPGSQDVTHFQEVAGRESYEVSVSLNKGTYYVLAFNPSNYSQLSLNTTNDLLLQRYRNSLP